MCKKSHNSQMYVECEGQFITKPYEVANYFNSFFINKVKHLRSSMQSNDVNLACNTINSIMSDKTCCFTFDTVNQDTVEDMLLSLTDDTSPGVDNLDGKVFKIAARLLSKPIVIFLIDALLAGVVRSSGKSLKLYPYLKIVRLVLLDPIVDLLAYYLCLVKSLKKLSLSKSLIILIVMDYLQMHSMRIDQATLLALH